VSQTPLALWSRHPLRYTRGAVTTGGVWHGTRHALSAVPACTAAVTHGNKGGGEGEEGQRDSFHK